VTLQEQIMAAFKNTPHPGNSFADIAASTYDDEGIVAYFAGKTWRGHEVKDLHSHYDALSFFTPKAFRYYLPAFLLADLSEEGNGILADFIAHAFTLRDNAIAQLYLSEFSKAELETVVSYFRMLSGQMLQENNEWSFDTFARAEEMIETHLASRP
jgi:hypothetical protein